MVSSYHPSDQHPPPARPPSARARLLHGTRYDPTQWEALRRYLALCNGGNKDGETSEWGRCQIGYPSCNNGAVPNGKFDTNNCGGFSTDFIGGSTGYAAASYEEREKIWHEHMDYVQVRVPFLSICCTRSPVLVAPLLPLPLLMLNISSTRLSLSLSVSLSLARARADRRVSCGQWQTRLSAPSALRWQNSASAPMNSRRPHIGHLRSTFVPRVALLGRGSSRS